MIIANQSKDKKLKSNALALAAEAKEAKRLDPETIDSTIGMMFDENGQMLESNVINRTIAEMTYSEKYSYSSTSGGKKFKDGILKWTFRKHYDYLTKNLHCEVMATPGGSGAIGNAMSNYLEAGQTVLVCDLNWPVYQTMAKERLCNIEYYELFNEKNEFNFEGLKKHVLDLKKRQNRVFLIINDPCHNPTGYSLSDEDWNNVINLINEVTQDGMPFILLYDMAYIDFSDKGIDGSRDILTRFTEFNESVLPLLAFSGSKTFSLYGLRIGALIAMCKTAEEATYFMNATEHCARGTWSNTAHIGITLVEKLFNSPEKTLEFENDIKKAASLLKLRGDIFVKEAKECGLVTYPYRSGFFVTIPCDSQAVFEKLKQKKIYANPIKPGIRISLSSISSKETVGLAKKIKECL